MTKPDTRFLTFWLAAVGALQELAIDVDLGLAAQETLKAYGEPAERGAFVAKETLLLRPIGRLLNDPHARAGFLGLHGPRRHPGEQANQEEHTAAAKHRHVILGNDPPATCFSAFRAGISPLTAI